MHRADILENPFTLIAATLLRWINAIAIGERIPLKWWNSGSGQRPIRREQICMSILGNPDRSINWREELQLELPWRKGRSLVERAWDCLAANGTETPSEALAHFISRPNHPLHCDVTRLLPEPPPQPRGAFRGPPVKDQALRWFEIDDTEFLRRALILGCCNDYFFDPAKPVIWTEKRLARRVRLFQTGDFYDEN